MVGARVAVIDTTLRDGQQSLWATRMTTPMILSIALLLDRVGYTFIDLMGAVHFDVCIRYLKENPWQRIRLVRERVTRTPLQAALRSRNFIGFDIFPEDVLELLCRRLAANGIDQVCILDGLHDMDNLGFNVALAKRSGLYTTVHLTYSISPVHTDAYYVDKARQILASGADALCVKDPSGLLTLDRVRTLLPALRAAVGAAPLHFHSHCLTGIAPLATLEAPALGADAVYTAIPPLSDGASLPSVVQTAENFRVMGYDVVLDFQAIDEISGLLATIAERERLPIGTVAPYDLFHYRHQLPGGMIANLRSQLETVGMSHRFRDILDEIPRVRQELGWPIMVSPFSQIVAVQALLNIVQGERYSTVIDEVAKWAYGYFGKLEAPIDPEVLDRIVTRAPPRIRRSAEPPPPMLPALRRAFPDADEDELALRAFFKGPEIDDMLAAPPIDLAYQFEHGLVRLVRRLLAASDSGRVMFSTAGMELRWQRAAQGDGRDDRLATVARR